MRQLHDGLPHLLLHQRRRGLRPGRNGHHDRAALGLVLQRRLRQGRRWQLPPAAAGPISTVAHPQVRHLARAVRHIRLRRVRAVHHMVPGRHRRARGARRHRSAVRGAAAARRPAPVTRQSRAAAPDQRAAQCPGAPRARGRHDRCNRGRRRFRDRRHVHPAPGAPRPGAPGRQTRPVRHGPPAGVLAAPDLGLARRRRAALAHHSCGRARHRGGRAPRARSGGRPSRTAGRGMAARARDGPRCRHRGGRHRAGPPATGDR